MITRGREAGIAELPPRPGVAAGRVAPSARPERGVTAHPRREFHELPGRRAG